MRGQPVNGEQGVESLEVHGTDDAAAIGVTRYRHAVRSANRLTSAAAS